MSTGSLIAALLMLAVIAFATLGYVRKEKEKAWLKSRELRAKFGSEYDRVLQSETSVRNAEALLEHREKRVAEYGIHPLNEREVTNFQNHWHVIEEEFLVMPEKAIAEAGELMDEVLKAQGYPIVDFDHQAEDLSVNHPRAVANYRDAHLTAVRINEGRVNTDELRSAMQNYCTVFEELIGQSTPQQEVV